MQKYLHIQKDMNGVVNGKTINFYKFIVDIYGKFTKFANVDSIGLGITIMELLNESI
jgi:hypothetical protein